MDLSYDWRKGATAFVEEYRGRHVYSTELPFDGDDIREYRCHGFNTTRDLQELRGWIDAELQYRAEQLERSQLETAQRRRSDSAVWAIQFSAMLIGMAAAYVAGGPIAAFAASLLFGWLFTRDA